MSERDEFSDQLVNGDLYQAVKRLASEDLKGCPLSRIQVAEALSRALHLSVTVAQIDAITAPTKEGHRFPAFWLPAWTRITGSTRILSLLCEKAGVWMATDTDRKFAELGRAHLKAKSTDTKISDLEQELGGKE